jgi:hypothetical protein
LGTTLNAKLSLAGKGVPKLSLGTRNRHAGGSRSFTMNFFKDLWGFLKVRKKFWLLPIILTLLFFGALMVFASGSAIAPFIYTIF